MNVEKLEKPYEFNRNDEIKVKVYSPSIVELTLKHYFEKPEFNYNYSEKKHYRKSKFKSNYSICRELKSARELLLTNIHPTDIPYTYFVTFTRDGLNSLESAISAFGEFNKLILSKYIKFKFITFYERSKDGNYHIHTIYWDPTHDDKYKFIKFDYFRNVWNIGNAKAKRPKDFEGLIKLSFYLSKKSKDRGKLLRNDTLFEYSDDLKEVPESEDYFKESLRDMEPLLTSNYRLTDEKNHLDVVITRKMYIRKDLLL